MGKQPDWIDLWAAFYWMRETFPFSIVDHEEALKNALLSGKVPVHGKLRGHWEYQRIEQHITDDTEFSVTTNTMRKNPMMSFEVFESVQVDRPAFEAWIN